MSSKYWKLSLKSTILFKHLYIIRQRWKCLRIDNGGQFNNCRDFEADESRMLLYCEGLEDGP